MYKITRTDERFLRVVFTGDFDDADATAYVQELGPFLQAATAENPLRLLVDAQEVGRLSVKARKILTELNSDPRSGETAVLGVNRFLMVLAQFILKASNRDNVRFFESEAEAVAWLNSHD